MLDSTYSSLLWIHAKWPLHICHVTTLAYYGDVWGVAISYLDSEDTGRFDEVSLVHLHRQRLVNS